MKKKRSCTWVKKIITPTFIKAVILLVPVTLLVFYKATSGELSLDDFFSIDTFSAIILAFLCQSIADHIAKRIEKKNEDSLKLTQDYGKLVKKYNRAELFRFDGKTYPTVRLCQRGSKDEPFCLDFDHAMAHKKYQLPAQVAANSDHLMKAHGHSKIYNQLNIRMDSLQKTGNKVTISYSQTYYYDSLITNRAMDYAWENGKSVREIYEPGPFLSALDDSKLSNHLGFNGFLETSDERIIFVRRGRDLSIGKSTWSGSIGASLKARYALSDEQRLNKDGLSQAIRMEIKDELYIDIDPHVDLTKSIFAFYRDVVEGGKPQFLFYYKLDNYTFAEFEKNFYNHYQKEDNSVDGTEFLGLSTQECRACGLDPNGMTMHDRFYNMTASTAASLAMLLQYFEG